MTKNKNLIALLLIVLVIAISTCAQKPGEITPSKVTPEAPAAPAETTIVKISTGGTGGTYYPLGGAMAKIFNENIP